MVKAVLPLRMSFQFTPIIYYLRCACSASIYEMVGLRFYHRRWIVFVL